MHICYVCDGLFTSWRVKAIFFYVIVFITCVYACADESVRRFPYGSVSSPFVLLVKRSVSRKLALIRLQEEPKVNGNYFMITLGLAALRIDTSNIRV